MSEALAAWTGLAVVYGGTTLLVSPAARVLGEPYSAEGGLRGNLGLWALGGAALAISLGWQRASAAELGFTQLGALTPLRALALVVAMRFVFVPLSLSLVAALGLTAFGEGIARFSAWPLALRVFAVLTGGVVEEILFRACALSYLSALGLHTLAAGAIATVLFALLHWPFWGKGPVVSITLTSAAHTAFFLWQRDLAACALAHVLVDANGLLLGPWLAKRRAHARRA